jgi:hypothetical protein
VEEIKLPWIRKDDDEYFARVVSNIFTPEECADILAAVNDKGFTPALLNIGGGRQQYVPSVRKGWRCILSSPLLADYICGVLKENVLPKQLPKRTHQDYTEKLVECNEYCRFLFYEPGEEFKPHYDGQYSRPPGHPHAGDRSKVTIQLYLNDVDAKYGGATSFLDPLGRRPKIPCQPKAGMALVFTQNLLHEGSQVKQGGIKYTMRTEAMYGSRDGEKSPQKKEKFDKSRSAKALTKK